MPEPLEAVEAMKPRPLASEMWRRHRRQIALVLFCIATGFVADIAYVATSRTALVVGATAPPAGEC